MKKYFDIVTHKRTLEMLLGCILLSVVICILCISGPMPNGSTQREVVLIFAPVIFMTWNVLKLRKCYLALGGKTLYYVNNIIAWGIFVLVEVCVYVFAPMDIYTWLFVATRFLRYTSLGVPSKIGIALFNVILFLSIFFAPIGLGWIKEKIKEQKALESLAPGVLEINPFENKQDVNEVDDKNATEKEKSSMS